MFLYCISQAKSCWQIRFFNRKTEEISEQAPANRLSKQGMPYDPMNRLAINCNNIIHVDSVNRFELLILIKFAINCESLI